MGMGKYKPLETHLKSINFNIWRVSFPKLEKILGFQLPPSARKYPAWWANQQNGALASNWIKSGYITTQLDLENEEITFIKGEPGFQFSDKIKPHKIYSNNKKQENIPWPWDVTEKLEATLSINWQPIGKITLEDNKLVFPNVSNLPGLYRIRIMSDGKEKRYIGESVNLQRRFGHYKNPGSRQQTNIRINDLLLKALNGGAEISLAIIIGNASIISEGQKTNSDLSDKATRRMFEHFAQVLDKSDAISSLNK